MKKRKKTFLLLELLIAFSLLSLFALPIALIPVKQNKKDIHALESIEATNLNDLAWTIVKEALYENRIEWKTLSTAKEKKPLKLNYKEHLEKTTQTQLPEKTTFNATLHFEKGLKSTPNGAKVGLLHCEIELFTAGKWSKKPQPHPKAVYKVCLQALPSGEVHE